MYDWRFGNTAINALSKNEPTEGTVVSIIAYFGNSNNDYSNGIFNLFT